MFLSIEHQQGYELVGSPTDHHQAQGSGKPGFPADGFGCHFTAFGSIGDCGTRGAPNSRPQAILGQFCHGIRCLEDDALVERLAAEQMPLTVCPPSNVRLSTVDTMAEHPLKRMQDLGLKVSIHSDDPACFGGYLEADFEAVNRVLGRAPGEQATLVRNSIESSFRDDEAKSRLCAQVEEWLAAGDR